MRLGCVVVSPRPGSEQCTHKSGERQALRRSRLPPFSAELGGKRLCATASAMWLSRLNSRIDRDCYDLYLRIFRRLRSVAELAMFACCDEEPAQRRSKFRLVGGPSGCSQFLLGSALRRARRNYYAPDQVGPVGGLGTKPDFPSNGEMEMCAQTCVSLQPAVEAGLRDRRPLAS